MEDGLNWLATIRDWATAHGVSILKLRVLDAFGWPGELEIGEAGCFEELESQTLQMEPELADRVAQALVGEVDLDQARMFGRRVAGVLSLMAPMSSASSWSRALRVTFVRRLIQVLDVRCPPATKPPRALRVRALADYYFSLGAVEFHRIKRGRQQPERLGDLVQSARWHTEVDGLRWTTLAGTLVEGPLRATVLELAPDKLRMEAMHRTEACSLGESLVTSASKRGAVAAVSGGFFLYSEPDIELPSRRYDPVGLLVTSGQIVSPPCFGRSAFIQRASGRCEIGRVGFEGLRVCCRDDVVLIDGHHWRVWTRVDGPRTPNTGVQVAVSANLVCAVSEEGEISVPLNGFVLIVPRGHSLSWPVGAKVQYAWADESDPIENAMAGGPDLLEVCPIQLALDGFRGTAPPRTFSGDETGDCNLLPRMGVGLLPTGRVVFVAVDGRNFDHALGLTLSGLADLMRELGCVRAMNLDGGSSKRMVIGGQTRDISATEVVGGESAAVGVRPVRSALFWHPR